MLVSAVLIACVVAEVHIGILAVIAPASGSRTLKASSL
jgi:hypothetical protein